MAEASEKQIAFAKAIARELEIQEPDYTKEACLIFISNHVNEYNNIRAVRSKMNSFYYEIDKCGRPNFLDIYGEETVSFLEENLRRVCGVYAFVGACNKLLYIGKSKDLGSRIVASYCERSKQLRIDDVYYYITPTEADASILEMYLITTKDPLLNTDGRVKDKPQMFKLTTEPVFTKLPTKREMRENDRQKILLVEAETGLLQTARHSDH